MTDIVRCERCKKNLIDEEFKSHSCSPVTVGYKDIDVDYYIVTKEPSMGRKIILAKGLDGVMYTLTVRPRTISDMISLSDENLQSDEKDKTDGDLTAPYNCIEAVVNELQFQ
jgi:hypothetical protein